MNGATADYPRRMLMPSTRPGTSNSVAQLGLPGFDSGRAEPTFDLFELIRSAFRRWSPEGKMPDIQVSRRMKRTLGTFTPSKNLIRLSSRLLALGTPQEQKHVALHEVAHAIVHHRTPRARAHGKEFRSACRELGLDAGRFVNIDHDAWRDRLRYAVECPSCGETILRRKKAHRVRCNCGIAVKPRTWNAVGLSPEGLKKL